MASAQLRQTSFLDFRITVRNQAAVIANLHSFEEDVLNRIRGVTRDWGHEIQDMAIELAPIGKDTDPPPHPGFLKANIELRFSKNGLAFEVGCWAEKFDAIGENLYAIFQEYGTSQHDAQPFLNPAYEWGKPLYVEDVTLQIQEEARRHGAAGSG